VLLLVVDGLGVGATPDAAEPSRTADTLGHVIPEGQEGRYPAWAALGLFAVRRRVTRPFATWTAPGYPGADSFAGHSALVGQRPLAVEPGVLARWRERLEKALGEAGHRLRPAPGGALVVDDRILVYDNLETAPGDALSVVGPLAAGERALLEVGRAVRHAVPTPRVIVYGLARAADWAAQVVARPDGRVGLEGPRAGLYARGRRVWHLGPPADPHAGLIPRVLQAGGRVAVVGKGAAFLHPDLTCERRPVTGVAAVLAAVEEVWADPRVTLVVATVEETDLAGHAGDAAGFAAVLRRLDRWLAGRRMRARTGEALVVTGDHGNDPALGRGHTREYLPVLGQGITWGPGPLAGLETVGRRVMAFLGVACGGTDAEADPAVRPRADATPGGDGEGVRR
jgi:phosphopentomutase